MFRRAFTLMEVLASLSVICVLIAVLLPALSQSRGAARRAECLANLRSLGAAVTSYRTDFRELFPDAPPVYDLPAGKTALLDALDLYLGTDARPWVLPDGGVSTPAPFRCPSDTIWAGARGMSYYYDAGLAIRIAREVELDPTPVETVSLRWMWLDSLPVLSDIPIHLLLKTSDPRAWHPRSGAQPRNAVYMGGHADWLKYLND